MHQYDTNGKSKELFLNLEFLLNKINFYYTQIKNIINKNTI